MNVRSALWIGLCLMSPWLGAPLSRASAQETPSEPAPSADEASAPAATDGETDTGLANGLANPLANLVSIPLQSNFDFGLGVGDGGFRYLLNVQPVIPIALDRGWIFITRLILPFVYQDGVVSPQGTGGGSVAGMADTTLSMWVATPPLAGVTLGVGPAMVLPTSTNEQLGPGHFAAGPTIVALWQGTGLTVGVLANHVWAATRSETGYIQTYVQPFVNYVLPTSTTLGVSSETSYEWHSAVWTVPLIVTVSQLVRIGPIPFSLGVAGRWFVEHPVLAPEWGLRATVTALLPVAH